MRIKRYFLVLVALIAFTLQSFAQEGTTGKGKARE